MRGAVVMLAMSIAFVVVGVITFLLIPVVSPEHRLYVFYGAIMTDGLIVGAALELMPKGLS